MKTKKAKLKIPLEIVDVIPVTKEFKANLFNNKIAPTPHVCRHRRALDREAYKHITHLTNMYVDRGLSVWGNYYIPYITQSTDEIQGDESVIYLN